MTMLLLHGLPILAQQNNNNAAQAGMLMFIFGFMCVGLVVGLGIQALICWFLSNCLKAIPEAHRKQDPKMVWLLMIPLFNIVWQFFVYPKIADSFKSYFDSIGRTDVGDCSRMLALVFCILVCCGIIPYLNICTGLAALVIWIIVLVKFSGYKRDVMTATPGPTA